MGVQMVKRARACGFKGSKQATLIALADRVNEKRLKYPDRCWPSMETLANDAGYCVRTVQNRVKELEQEGHLTRIYRTNKPTMYWVHPGGKRTPAKSAGVQKLHPSPADIAANPRRNCGETIMNQKRTGGATPVGDIASQIVAKQVERRDTGDDSDPVDPEEFGAFVKAYGQGT